MDIKKMNVGKLLVTSASTYPDNTAIVFEGEKITFRALNTWVNRLAHGLKKLGIKKGEKVSILFYNSPQFIETYFALVKIGAVVVPLNFRLVGRELKYQIENSDSKALIYSSEFKEVVNSIKPQLSRVNSFICWGKEIPSNTFDHQELMAGGSGEEPSVDVSLKDGCVIYYTAGTTGFSKGALRTHENVLWDCISWAVASRSSINEKTLCIAPLFHIAGFEIIYLSTVLIGSTAILMKSFDPQAVFEIIQREKITSCFFVPAMTIALLNSSKIKEYDLSSLKTYVTASAPLPHIYKENVIQLFPRINFIEGYGMNEVGGLTYLPPEDALRKKVCVGKPLFNVSLRVVDDEGRDVPSGKIGEILVQGPGIMEEYYRNPEGTKEVIKEGWFYTGDVGYTDEEGYLYIVDRKRDMVITGGENVYSAEVEDILAKHPKVKEVAVIGLPHDRWGEVVTALIVLKEGQKAQEEEFIKFCQKDLAGYKCPKVVKFVDILPRNTYGKVLKRELRERFSTFTP